MECNGHTEYKKESETRKEPKMDLYERCITQHSLSRFMMVSPAHQYMLHKRGMCKVLSENVSKLVSGVDLHERNVVDKVSSVFTESIVLDGIVIRAGSHVMEF